MNLFLSQRLSSASTTVSQWTACRCASKGMQSMVLLFGIPAVWQEMYRMAYEQAVLAARRARPGRIVEPSLN